MNNYIEFRTHSHRYLIQNEKYILGTVNLWMKFIKTICYRLLYRLESIDFERITVKKIRYTKGAASGLYTGDDGGAGQSAFTPICYESHQGV